MPVLCTLVALTLLAGPMAAPPPVGWPVDSSEITEAFDPPQGKWSAGHRGVDFAAVTGGIVRAMASGTVAFVGTVAGKPVITVALAGPAHPRSTYEPVVASVQVGEQVLAGEVIGTVAVAGGHCGGARGCVHVGVRTDTGYLDPLSLLRRPPAVLKPIRRALARPPTAA